ncbi:hypothetical protein LDC_0359 [sediment metagenome]|uniref:Uncharacterized protein n=1 Tax=sediment metagenome TaxID=749907 RepID=D9PFR6_9ZZZZ
MGGFLLKSGFGALLHQVIHLLGGREDDLDAATVVNVKNHKLTGGEGREFLIGSGGDSRSGLQHAGLLDGARGVLCVLPWLLVDSLGDKVG